MSASKQAKALSPADPRLLAFADALAVLYADLWVAGKLDELPESPPDGSFEDE